MDKEEGVGEVEGNRIHQIRPSPANRRWPPELGSSPTQGPRWRRRKLRGVPLLSIERRRERRFIFSKKKTARGIEPWRERARAWGWGRREGARSHKVQMY